MASTNRSGGLSVGVWLHLDLLRQRRQRLGLERPKVVPVRELLWRGGLIGAVAPVLLLLAVLFLVVQDRQLAHRQKRLEPLAAEHDRVDQALIAVTKSWSKPLHQFRHCQGHGDVRSSSAVLAEVRQLVPELIALDRQRERQCCGDQCSAQQPNGLRLVNALMLRLSASGFCSEQVKLVESGSRGKQARGASVRLERWFCSRCCLSDAYVSPIARSGGHGSPHGSFGAGGFGEVTNFQADRPITTAAWLSPERAVFVVPILAGLALAAALASVVITPQMVRLGERREVVDLLNQKSEALPGLLQTLAQRRRDQAQVMAQQKRLLALIAGTAELETFLAQLNDLASRHQVVVTTTKPGAVEIAPVPAPSFDAPVVENLAVGDPLLRQGLEKRSSQLEVEGPFVQVLAFLQALEKLEVFWLPMI